MLTQEEYEAKRQARYERLIAAAERADREGDAARKESDRISSFIPPGQPILIGHHSEKRHRRDLETIRNKARKGYELHQKAAEYRSRAESTQSNDAIMSDNPEAVDLLAQKIEQLEARQEIMKAVNAAYKKFLKNPASLDTSGLTESEKNFIRAFAPEWSGDQPYARYELANNRANIRTAKKRAELVERKQAIPDKDEQIGEVKIEWRASENRIRIYYPGRVPRETFDLLRQHGFRALHNVREGAFSAYYNRNAGEYVRNEIKKETP